MSERKSIPTRYANILFRSKLEADWAMTFDALGIEWRYEPEGRYFGRQFYLVDFYLPRSRQWVEVKGVFEPDDVRKLTALLANVPARPFTNDEHCPDIALVAALKDGEILGWVRGDYAGKNLLDISRDGSRSIELFQCQKCRGWWFADGFLSFRCQCCGMYDGAKHLADRIAFPLRSFPLFPSSTHDAAD